MQEVYARVDLMHFGIGGAWEKSGTSSGAWECFRLPVAHRCDRLDKIYL